MKKLLLAACLVAIQNGNVTAQNMHRCGTHDLKLQLAAKDPEFYQKQDAYFAKQAQLAEEHEMYGSAGKSTAQGVIPVIFHIMLTSAQQTVLGGNVGITQRCIAQIDQLNKDFNKKNADSTGIMAGFKPLYGNANIQFALAHRKPNGASTPGFEVITTTVGSVPEQGGAGSGYAYSGGKYNGTVSTQWDCAKYLNVWVVNPQGSLLGIAAPPSMTDLGGLPVAERGLLIHYMTLGNKNYTSSQNYNGVYDLGRTLVHETGHYFEIWHVWGDDGGACPGTGGQDDGIADTPPQADQTFGALTGTQFDACTSTGNGIMYINFMDYSDDNRLLMFTKNQATKMHTFIDASNSESYSLTQHPELTWWPTDVTSIETEHAFDVYPNPTNGKINISFNGEPSSLRSVTVTNMVGQQVYSTNAAANSTIYNIDITGMAKGVYFVQCNFEEGVVTRKIVME